MPPNKLSSTPIKTVPLLPLKSRHISNPPKQQKYLLANFRTTAENSHFSFFSSLFATLLLGAGLSLVRAKVAALIVFGDSSVDTGNNNGIQTVLKSNFEPYGQDFEGGRATGRFSNGRVTADFLSEYFGLKKTLPAYLDPNYKIADFSTGVVFASAGTGYDNTTASVLNVIPFWKEIQYYMEYQGRLRKYLGDQKAKETASEAVYLISIGTNDFLENYYVLPTTRLQYSTVQQFEDHLVGVAKKFIENIYSLGARKISLGGLPPMGCLPLERTINFLAVSECNEEYNNVALEFNGKLKGLVDQLNKEMPGVRMVFSNPYYIMMQMIKKPSLYGFDVTSRACCGTGLTEMSYMCEMNIPLTCSDPNKYMFWDSFHPTEKTNQLIAQHVFKTVLHTFV